MHVVPAPDQLARIEAALAFHYPPTFLAFLRSSTATLFAALPAARLVVSVEQVRAFHGDAPGRARLPPHLIPFVVEPQASSEDVYCFDLGSTPPEYRVSVFSLHAEVHDWPSFSAWAAWLSQLERR